LFYYFLQHHACTHHVSSKHRADIVSSKYHYVSLRPAISTEAHRLNAYGDSSGQLHIAPQDGDFGAHDDMGGDQEILTEDESDGDDDDLGDLSETYVVPGEWQ
jgi:hypothetical protein